MDAVGRAFEGKRVFVTGHTGFKGSWLCEWLLLLGAEVHGFSLPPPTEPALFEQLKLAQRLKHRLGDVRAADQVRTAITEAQPAYVFHLAAQSLVRRSYADPLETFATNAMGTANVLAALDTVKNPCAVIVVTSDKCYENPGQGRSHGEGDALGGSDLYSASKAAAEIVTAGWRTSFYRPEKIAAGLAPSVAIATARAGNVIGGGDWAVDRIVPDCMRALGANRPVQVRNPSAVRPWQHVLEPLGGYLSLAAQLRRALDEKQERLVDLCTAFNFGPKPEDHRTVSELVAEVLRHWPGRWEDGIDPAAVHEAQHLSLATDKVKRLLGWTPRWDFEESVARTVAWYRLRDGDVRNFTRQQIADFTATPG